MHVAGYFTGAMGTGEHARQLVAALRTQGVAITTTTLRPDGAPEDQELGRGLDAPAGDPGSAYGRFNLLCANADMVPIVSEQLGRRFFAGRYTIGFWAWEVSSFPEQFAGAFDHVDEVWVGSEHVRDAVSAAATVPVLAIPQPISLSPEAEQGSPPPGLPAGFRFLFAFDYLSVFERKNPIATIEAFTRAFSPGSGAVLIVKSLNDHFDPAAHQRLRAAAAAHADVHLLEGRMSRSDRDGLLNAADCYVSLHRAEGFGYTLAESMWLGKPVIATGYSGNLDFMTEDNSYLVAHRLVPIGSGNDPYPADGSWAEPDVDHAAALMREVFDGPAEAAARGQRAAAEIRSTHAPEVAGRAMVARLRSLEASAIPSRSPQAGLRDHAPVPEEQTGPPIETDDDALAAAYDARTTQLYEARAGLAEAVSALTVELRELRDRAGRQAEMIAGLEADLHAAQQVIEEQRNMKIVRWTRWPRQLVYRVRGRGG